ncbi:DUF3014 domain-containing protein [Pseudidiomarina insulisalsae]|uniref:DUF3014 domain-containing protein n=1 Tax=Pseudidiomarina insulisalsae TaxID=575789 RepID=A0A432YCM3_9GAMM|nr:DUF3014 domain-containing protein [Pseudidiomarina insulisalsae]RUO58755.1 DUF3014 domain-containing protein [Pseudidiomarina insulisalsae]
MSDTEFSSQKTTPARGKLMLASLVVIAIAVAIIWYVSQDQQPPRHVIEQPVEVVEPEVPVVTEAETELVEEPADTVELGEPEAEPEVTTEQQEPEPELPPLAQSTEPVLEQLKAAGQPVEPIQSEQLIRDAVVFVDNLRNGVVVKDAAIVSGPKARFRVLEQDGKIYIDPRSYDRYNTVVDWFVSLDTDVVVSMLDDYEPLVQQALTEIGYPDTAPETVIFDAIDMLMQTPSVGTVIELTDETVMYRYADPALEALPEAQKQMLRLGPDNMRRVKLKLESIREAMRNP